ncbi:MAG: beta-ketoacyl-[acyl-carrier-protein] synthase family protein [Pseudomonadota bacterium]|nr:beta-ketoacyl-[acyl-carrier-protein] synthase family protein [Pseudomonadota bacterium]
MHRVAVTGLGVTTPLGNSVEELCASLLAGRSGVRRLASPQFDGLRSPIGASMDFDGAAHFPSARLRMLDRFSQLALLAAAQAIAGAGIEFAREQADRCGVSVGSGLGGAGSMDEGYETIYAERSDRVKPYTVLASMTNAAAAWIGIDHEIRGPNLTYSTACSSSAVAIGEAARRIRSGDADIMVAGGAEAPLTLGVLRAWEAMRTIAAPDAAELSASCRPFALTRSGLVLGEGAAFVILEDWQHAIARGAHVHAELTGYGLTTDAAHITRPTAAGQAAAMRAALGSAALPREAVDYINAHGTATLQNDSVETAAIKEVFGTHARRLAVSSTKSMHGHLLGAAGALEFLIAVVSLERGIVPPTMHLNVADPTCDLDYVAGAARRQALRAVMTNSFAFGGTNAVLIVESPGRLAVNAAVP